VVLGAGLDTFAYRSTFPNLRVFEIDHSATQGWKRHMLERAGIAIPSSLEYVPIDFEKRTLSEGLSSSGFDRAAPAFFSWLGVTMYLAADTVMGVFRFIAGLPSGGGVAFDYSVSPSRLGMMERMARAAFARRVAAIGEPWTTSFDPDVLVNDTPDRVSQVRISARTRSIAAASGRSDGLRVGARWRGRGKQAAFRGIPASSTSSAYRRP
jgi:methyltransferase (TIGR00027 family)